jgi:hypothetical protein
MTHFCCAANLFNCSSETQEYSLAKLRPEPPTQVVRIQRDNAYSRMLRPAAVMFERKVQLNSAPFVFNFDIMTTPESNTIYPSLRAIRQSLAEDKYDSRAHSSDKSTDLRHVPVRFHINLQSRCIGITDINVWFRTVFHNLSDTAKPLPSPTPLIHFD